MPGVRSFSAMNYCGSRVVSSVKVTSGAVTIKAFIPGENLTVH